MAFRRTDVNIPQEVIFPEDLNKLGFTVNAAGQVIDKVTGEFFKFEKYANHSTNQQRYNAMHKTVRKEVYHTVSTMGGVTDLYFCPDPLTKKQQVLASKPASPSIRILSSPDLSKCKEIYVVVGDSKQDLGMFSRKAMLTEDGLFNGTVLGLVGTLRGAAMSPDSDDEAETPEKDIPGVVVFNPGELLWSPEAGECMSAVTWLDRQRAHGFAIPYKVTDQYQKVPGHEDAGVHVRHCLDSFLKSAVAPNTHINIVTIGDGSEHVLTYLDALHTNDKEKAELANIHMDIAMVSPTHNDDDVTDPALKQLLAKHGRIWESHSLPKGNLLADVAPEFRSLVLPPSTQQADSKGLDSGCDESESEYDDPDTPPGELSKRTNPIDYFRRPGLTMPPTKRRPVAEERKADEQKGIDMQSVSQALAAIQAEGKSSLCQRFSAGVEDTADMIFPKVMGDVLQFFKEG